MDLMKLPECTDPVGHPLTCKCPFGPSDKELDQSATRSIIVDKLEFLEWQIRALSAEIELLVQQLNHKQSQIILVKKQYGEEIQRRDESSSTND